MGKKSKKKKKIVLPAGSVLVFVNGCVSNFVVYIAFTAVVGRSREIVDRERETLRVNIQCSIARFCT